MMRSKRLKMVFFLVFVLGVAAFSQDAQSTGDKDKELREEILAVYQSKGEQGLRVYVENHKDKLTFKFIVDFAKAGVKERKEKWLKACEIIAKEKKNGKDLADVYLKMAEYFRLISKNEKAFEFIEEALALYVKLHDIVGQGNVYLGKGIIYYNKSEYDKAQEMYDKAMPFFEKAGDLLGQGHIYMRRGNCYRHFGDYLKADKMYEIALSIFEKLGYLSGQNFVFISKGDNYLITGNISKALELHTKAMSFFEKDGDPLGLGNAAAKMGEVYFYSQNYDKALEMFDRSLSVSEKAKNFIGVGNAYFGKGEVYTIIGNNLSALEMFEKSKLFYERAGDPIRKVDAYLAKAQLYYFMGDNDMAEKMCDKAFPIIEKSLNIEKQVNFFLLKGNIYISTGEIKKAEKAYDKALVFLEKKPQPLRWGIAFQGKGSVYFYKGEFLKALEMYDKSIFFNTIFSNHVALGNAYRCKGDIFLYNSMILNALEMYEKAISSFLLANEPRGIGSVYLRKGDIYLKSSCMSKARDMYKKSLPYFEKAGDLKDQGNINLRMGESYFYTEEDSKALEMYEKALPFYENTKDFRGQGNVYSRKGDIYLKTGNYTVAIDMYEKAISHYEQPDAIINQSVAFRGIGDIYFRNAEYSKALEMYDKALALDTKIGDITSETTTIYRKARLFAIQKIKSKALAHYEKVIFNTEKIRYQIAFSAEMKRTFLDQAYKQYEEATLFMLENKYYEKGFTYAESMRARVFLDQMAEGLASLEKGLKTELKEERDLLVGKLSAIYRQIQETGVKDEKKLQELKAEYRKFESEFEDLRIKIRLENPLYASVNYPQPVSLQELQKEVLKDNETLLSYFISQDESYAFVISKDNFSVEPLKIKEKEVNSLVERYSLAIKENNLNDMNKYGNRLYEKLFTPLEKYLAKSSNIIIVPAGQLETIPFESFIIDNKKTGRPLYLLEKYRLKYVQSATLLSILRKHFTGDSNSKGFIGFGDPVYDYENFKQGKPEQGSMNIFATESTEGIEGTEPIPGKEEGVEDEIKDIFRGRYARAGGIMDRLPHSGEEIQTIAHLFEKESLNTKVYLRDQAAEENARAGNMKDYAYIHFSCHGLLNDDFQCLVLSQLTEAKEDGYFTLNEIMNCDYNAKLIVLSACRTGSGKMARGEGITGLTRAFMYAGSPAVVASLWDVDDVATKELMVKFYSNMLQKNPDKVEALRQAKLELLKDEKYFSPIFWSAFVMYGE